MNCIQCGKESGKNKTCSRECLIIVRTISGKKGGINSPWNTGYDGQTKAKYVRSVPSSSKTKEIDA